MYAAVSISNFSLQYVDCHLKSRLPHTILIRNSLASLQLRNNEWTVCESVSMSKERVGEGERDGERHRETTCIDAYHRAAGTAEKRLESAAL